MTQQFAISSDDRILATLTLNGATVASLTDSSFGSLSEIIDHLRRLASGSGLGKIFVRNFTRGWHLDRPIYLRRAAA